MFFAFCLFDLLPFGGHFKPFWNLYGHFLGGVGVWKCFWDLFLWTNDFCFENIYLYLFFHVVWAWGWLGWFFGDYRVTASFLLFCIGVVVMVGVGLWQLISGSVHLVRYVILFYLGWIWQDKANERMQSKQWLSCGNFSLCLFLCC